MKELIKALKSRDISPRQAPSFATRQIGQRLTSRKIDPDHADFWPKGKQPAAVVPHRRLDQPKPEEA